MSSEEQAARATLRLDFISLINKLNGRKCEITTSEGNKLACSFVTLDRNGEKIGVENLETPANGVLPHAILRSQDIDQIILFPQ